MSKGMDIKAKIAVGLCAAGALLVVGLQVSRLFAHGGAPVPAAASASPTAQAPAAAANADAPAPISRPPAQTAHVDSDGHDHGHEIKRILKIDGPMKHGDYVWDEKGVPAGPLVITVDLKAQTLSVFRNGYEIGATVILYGADNKQSPTGTFPIIEKDADHVSNLYDAPMPYMLRLTNDGVAIHASDVKLGNATHGCIGVPLPFAKLLFDRAKLGDRVIVTNGRIFNVGADKLTG